MAIARKRRHRETGDMSLNVTSLMDVLTVLLFFLIKSFSVTSTSLLVPEGLALPHLDQAAGAEEALVVSLSKTDLRVGERRLAKLNSGSYSPSDVAGDGSTILPLKHALDKEIKKRNALFEGTDSSRIPPAKILLQVDKRLPFATVKLLLHTASQAGYSDYQFAVMKTLE